MGRRYSSDTLNTSLLSLPPSSISLLLTSSVTEMICPKETPRDTDDRAEPPYPPCPPGCLRTLADFSSHCTLPRVVAQSLDIPDSGGLGLEEDRIRPSLFLVHELHALDLIQASRLESLVEARPRPARASRSCKCICHVSTHYVSTPGPARVFNSIDITLTLG